MTVLITSLTAMQGGLNAVQCVISFCIISVQIISLIAMQGGLNAVNELQVLYNNSINNFIDCTDVANEINNLISLMVYSTHVYFQILSRWNPKFLPIAKEIRLTSLSVSCLNCSLYGLQYLALSQLMTTSKTLCQTTRSKKKIE